MFGELHVMRVLHIIPDTNLDAALLHSVEVLAVEVIKAEFLVVRGLWEEVVRDFEHLTGHCILVAQVAGQPGVARIHMRCQSRLGSARSHLRPLRILAL